MSDARDLKVFISWSGELSKAVAVELRQWIPLLFDTVRPWASDVDIAAGQRSLQEIEAELAGTTFGIVVVTQSNQNAPWINFEAGALSRVVDRESEHRVVPLLVDIASPGQVAGPLGQFHAKVLDESGTRDLVLSLAQVAGIQPDVMKQRFTVWWPTLEAAVTAARAADPAGAAEHRDPDEMLDEILTHVRAIRNTNPGGGLYSLHGPAEYLWRSSKNYGLVPTWGTLQQAATSPETIRSAVLQLAQARSVEVLDVHVPLSRTEDLMVLLSRSVPDDVLEGLKSDITALSGSDVRFGTIADEDPPVETGD